ncbi:MAG TPA: FAD-binding oxidoreductase [Euryarchaeota archaeon]|nr:FAD-binding oxidoreductase [Euryarchaeota archaeon]
MDDSLRSEVVRQVASVIGEEKVLHEKADLIPYTKDTYTLRFGEEYKYLPDLVVLPESTEDVQRVVEIAARHKVPLLPKGGGSNRTGMLVPVLGGIIVDTVKMNRVIEIDKPNLSVTVQSGITLKTLEEELNKHGLALNQEQGSLKIATIGGSISTTGFSRRHNKYGTIGDRIMSLEVVLADGRILRTGKKVLYTSTGYRLSQLFLGAEGTLGIITEATLRVEPMPETRDAILAFYDDFWGANEAGKKLKASGINFVGAEVYEDPETANWGAPEGKIGIFFVMFDGLAKEVEAQLEFVRGIVHETGGLIAEDEYAHKMMNYYEMIWCGARALTSYQDSVTPVIPQQHTREFYDKLYNDIMPRYGLDPLGLDKYSLDVGRYCMTYGRFIIPSGEDGYENYRKAVREIAELSSGLGGSIAGCQGVGLAQMDNMDIEFSEVALEIMRNIKKCLDPDNIMNPGKKFRL